MENINVLRNVFHVAVTTLKKIIIINIVRQNLYLCTYITNYSYLDTLFIQEYLNSNNRFIVAYMKNKTFKKTYKRGFGNKILIEPTSLGRGSKW